MTKKRTSACLTYFIQSHGHGADKGLDACGALVIGSSESPANVLVVEHLYFEREVLLEVFEDHHQERELDPESLTRIRRARDEGCRDVSARDLED